MQQLQCNWSTKSIKPWNRDLGFINPRNHNISVITVLIRIRNLLICPQQKLIFVILKRFERQVLIFHCLNLRGRGAQLRWSGGPLRTSSHQHEASPSTLTMPCDASSPLCSSLPQVLAAPRAFEATESTVSYIKPQNWQQHLMQFNNCQELRATKLVKGLEEMSSDK